MASYFINHVGSISKNTILIKNTSSKSIKMSLIPISQLGILVELLVVFLDEEKTPNEILHTFYKEIVMFQKRNEIPIFKCDHIIKAEDFEMISLEIRSKVSSILESIDLSEHESFKYILRVFLEEMFGEETCDSLPVSLSDEDILLPRGL